MRTGAIRGSGRCIFSIFICAKVHFVLKCHFFFFVLIRSPSLLFSRALHAAFMGITTLSAPSTRLGVVFPWAVVMKCPDWAAQTADATSRSSGGWSFSRPLLGLLMTVFSMSSGSRPSVCVCVLISSYRDTSHVGLFWILLSH